MTRVSCLMTTRDRPHFVAQAVRCFARRTYADAELIVVDAGEHSLADGVCDGVENVRYVRGPAGATYGACLNIAASEGSGEILQLIDDDDYYAPRFLERSVMTLEQTDSVDTIAAWDCFHVFVYDQPHVRFSGHGWAAGATLCFRRALWERVRFRDEGGHQDHFFVEDSQAALARVCAPELYMLVRHGQNSWTSLRGTDVDAYFRSLPALGFGMEDVVAAEDREFYGALAR